MTSYAELARILAASLQGTACIAAVRISPRNELAVILKTGETFILAAIYMPPSELERIGAGEVAQ